MPKPKSKLKRFLKVWPRRKFLVEFGHWNGLPQEDDETELQYLERLWYEYWEVT